MAEAPVTIHHLPDFILIEVFNHLSLDERHRAVPLVCRHWRDLVNSPQLLRSIDVRLGGGAGHYMPRLQQLGTWLAMRAAGHVKQMHLRLVCWKQGGPGRSCQAGQEASVAADAMSSLTSGLAACGGQLTELTLFLVLTPLKVCSWAAAQRRLRRLELTSVFRAVEVTAPLRGLTALEDLRLSGREVVLPPAPSLPASITQLLLGGYNGDDLAQQLTGLPGLCVLGLVQVGEAAADSLGELTCLTSLQLLEFSNSKRLPPCLSQLTSLVALHITDTPLPDQSDQAAVEASATALPAILKALTCLTELVLCNTPCSAGLLGSLAGLSQLQRFAWHGYQLQAQDCALMAGPWLAALRWLSVPADVASRSLDVLAAAPHLESFTARDYAARPSQEQLDLLHWAVQHPMLKQLCLGGRGGKLEVEAALLDAVLEAQREKPSLSIDYAMGCGHTIASAFV